MWLVAVGREVLRLYGRLRGVPAEHLEAMVDNLLQRLGLGQYADRVCDSYSGGNKRKLSVAIALVGGPPAVLMDEPSTGMDPGAKRFLWDLIQKQVVDAGIGILTSLLLVLLPESSPPPPLPQAQVLRDIGLN